jgi:BTB/POZ domain
MHLTTSINPNLFSKELEYLYTGKGLGAAFEFFYDSSEHYREEGDAEENRIDKLRKDLVFMWRSRLYSDVRIGIEGSSSAHHEGLAAVFSTHRFILVSRSDYFHNALIAWKTQKPEIRDDDEDDDRSVEPPLMLPSPPFTPPSLHFVLGFIYTGTLIFSNRTYDLDTAFHIMRSATYISLTSLYDEIQARIVQEMMHGLFHAYVEFAEYERITGGKWGVSGCRCRQCARRIPRVIEFALLDDVKNELLQRGARRGLVGMFGEGWCNAEFVKLDKKIRDAALKGVAKRTTPLNVFPLLFAAEFSLTKLKSIIDPWADTSRDMILDARRQIDHLLCSQADECFSRPEWLELMNSDGAKFEDRDHLEWIIKSVQRGFTEKSAGRLYQVCPSILVPHVLFMYSVSFLSGSCLLDFTPSTRFGPKCHNVIADLCHQTEGRRYSNRTAQVDEETLGLHSNGRWF